MPLLRLYTNLCIRLNSVILRNLNTHRIYKKLGAHLYVIYLLQNVD